MLGRYDKQETPMTLDEHLLICLAEECSEVVQRITKALRFGLDEVQPGQEFTNSQRIGQELIDVAADLLTTPRQALYTALRRNTN